MTVTDRAYKRCRITVTGKVQGVWYRKSAVAEGQRLGLSGFAMNLVNGDVMLEAEGAPADLDRFIRWCEAGPPLARVNGITVEPLPVLGSTGFEVRYGPGPKA